MKLFSKLANNKKPEGLNPDALRRATSTERLAERRLSPAEVQDEADRLHELAVLSLFLHSAGTLEEMLSLFLERAPRVTGAIVTYPLLLDRRREVLTATALASIDDAGLEQASLAANENLADMEYPLPLRSWLRDVMEAGEVVLADDLRNVLGETLGKEACDRIRHELDVTTVAVVPLVMEGEAFGVCVLLFSHRKPDVEVLELAAGHCTLVLKAMMVGEETTRFGGIDPVTWAHSRGHFLELLESEVVRARRTGRGLSLVFLDIDDFGEFNATYGHTLGDRLLRAVAMLLSSAISLPEVVARYGGDEFALLLPETNRAVAVELTSSIVNRLEALSVFEAENQEMAGVPVSAAIISYPEDGSSREELLTAGEMELEQSKQERRAMRRPARQLTPLQQLRLTGKRHTA
ncbi:MAG TPA: sensor domain-containing diguanylate cyclase [Dehalococcoidia bacterium]|jgi:diguanylate cyclase (GGDEF)-like protein|nr:sensor domain-containing diguanylate cyclase [Dehalococcoidia bacterium]